ncbi:hypothetical protein ABEW34_17995 [Paenibacillus algorifonticola]|uniref:hypothetical protein n=1 Tax=Paenibacillus algorifonticola TaxID=684063 RepID=UPI003D26D69F
MKPTRNKVAIWVSSLMIGMILFGAIIGINALNKSLDIFNMFRSFTLTIHNESDHELVTVQAGVLASDEKGNIIETDSKQLYDDPIASGSKKKITPELNLTGEGGIYITYTDSTGFTRTTSVCSYTESLSGSSTITIYNDDAKVEENCY